MATVQKEFDAGAALHALFNDIPYVKKLGYTIDDVGGVITVRVIFDDVDDFDAFSTQSMTSVKKTREFEEMLPDHMEAAYYVLPLVGPPTPGGLDHFRRMTAVLDRQ